MGSRRFDRIVATLARRQPDLAIAMENVHKTRNLGAVARTCDAVGIGTIHAITPDASSIKLGHKTAGGTEKWISVRQHFAVARAYEEFRAAGLTILAADVGSGAVDFREINYTVPTIIVVGSELDGLSRKASANADRRIQVPMQGMVESLNVSVATGIILYEALRQREIAGQYAERRIGDSEYHRLLFEWLHPAVASYCKVRGRAYPDLDDNGDITEAITGNRRDGLQCIFDLEREY